MLHSISSTFEPARILLPGGGLRPLSGDPEQLLLYSLDEVCLKLGLSPDDALRLLQQEEAEKEGRPDFLLTGPPWLVNGEGIVFLLMNGDVPSKLLAGLRPAYDEVASLLAGCSDQLARRGPRGIYQEGDHGSRGCWFAFGTDGYAQDERSWREVALLRKGLPRLGAEDLGFAVGGAGRTWVLLLRPAATPDAERGDLIKFHKELLDLLRRSWDAASGTVDSDPPDDDGDNEEPHSIFRRFAD